MLVWNYAVISVVVLFKANVLKNINSRYKRKHVILNMFCFIYKNNKIFKFCYKLICVVFLFHNLNTRTAQCVQGKRKKGIKSIYYGIQEVYTNGEVWVSFAFSSTSVPNIGQHCIFIWLVQMNTECFTLNLFCEHEAHWTEYIYIQGSFHLSHYPDIVSQL